MKQKQPNSSNIFYLLDELKRGILKGFVARIYTILPVTINVLVMSSSDKSPNRSIRVIKKFSFFKI